MDLARALVIVNPAAGGGRAPAAWERARRQLHLQTGIDCVPTEAPGHARQLARQAVARGVERVVAVGGDGTVSEVAAGLAGTDASLGIVPAGTGNDFSHTLGLPRQPAAAARLALHGFARRIDLGHVQLADRSATFVNVAGCGFDAEVVRRTRAARGVGGTLPYLLAVLRSVWTFRPRSLRLVLDDGDTLTRRALSVAVAIGPSYGGGLRIAPQAAIDDGLLDVCLIGDLHPLELLAVLPRAYRGTHIRHPKVELFRCRELHVESASSEPTGCQADGELVGQLPARFSIQPGGLWCVVGRPA